MQTTPLRDQKWITYWLFTGCIMVFVQILLGGITRLTGSGLSITHWDIIMGAIPPLNESQWLESFSLYQQTPQYQHINEGMSLDQFKFIFYWEYTHRLWARSMGIVFLIPFLFFLFRKSLSREVLKRLALVIFLAALAAVFGWIMVASGLIDRPWVNAYKLTVHLILGILLFITLFFTWLKQKGYKRVDISAEGKSWLFALVILASVQIIFGGFVAGMKSAMFYPTWPEMNGEWIPDIILDGSHWNMDNFLLYDQSGFMPALIQFIHRILAYLIFLLAIPASIYWFRHRGRSHRYLSIILLGIIVVQITLGIMTLLHSIGSVPVLFGSLHQSIGILFFTFLLYLLTITNPKKHIN